jgi:uncharacterized protein YndB with AHSA1/START domain
MIDVTHQISAIDRQVGSRVLEAGEARTVVISLAYDATVDEVWDACTNPERIPRWFLPVTGELKEGGRYQLEGNAEGTIERCDPPHGFDATWEFGGQVTWIEVWVSPDNERTRLTLTHIAHVDDETWAQFGPGAVGIGWELGLVGLALHLSSGEAVDPAEFAVWSGSDEGRQFMQQSGEGWRDAHVASGLDPEDLAMAAGSRCIEAYTAAPEGDAGEAGNDGDAGEAGGG